MAKNKEHIFEYVKTENTESKTQKGLNNSTIKRFISTVTDENDKKLLDIKISFHGDNNILEDFLDEMGFTSAYHTIKVKMMKGPYTPPLDLEESVSSEEESVSVEDNEDEVDPEIEVIDEEEFSYPP